MALGIAAGRFAGQVGNLLGNLLFGGEARIDPGYREIDKQTYETKSDDLLNFSDLVIEGLISKSKQKRNDNELLPYLPNKDRDVKEDSCAACRARMATSKELYFADPCRGVCGG
jgi:hypothetical protein